MTTKTNSSKGTDRQPRFEELDHHIDGDVLADALHRCMLATDGSIYELWPAAVVYPKNTTDVVQTLKFAQRNRLSLHARGAGSGLCGAALGQGIVIDFTRYMHRLIALDIEHQSFECEPGYRLGELNVALTGTGLFFPPDPSSGEYATFGGMYGTNASGAHSVKYGNVADYIIDAELVLANGKVTNLSTIASMSSDELPDNLKQIYHLFQDHRQTIEGAYPAVRSNSAGYNLLNLVRNGHLHLERLFAGAEGTLGIVTRLKFRLIKKPPHDSLVVAYFNDMLSAVTAVQKLMADKPSGIEIMDKSLLKLARDNSPVLRDKIPVGVDNVLLIEFDAPSAEECRRLADKACRLLRQSDLSDNVHLAVSIEEKEKFWAVRKAAVPILYKLKQRKRILALVEDAAVPIDRLAEYVTGIYAIMQRHRVQFVLYGHIAKGLLHTRPLLDLKTAQDVALLRTLADDVFELVMSLKGSISGEHGDGRIRSTYVKRQYPQLYPLFQRIKRSLDPGNILNPALITSHDPNQMKKDLRFGAGYHRREFQNLLLQWDNDFEDEVEKCHGCSKCTTVSTATRMCPIYKFTREEAASPKSKANILRALISLKIDNQSLYESAFQYVIDRCVNCGSCQLECPSNVQIPKMAVEARSQYAQRFGVSLGHRLLVQAEAAGRYTRKFAPLMRQIMNPHPMRRFNQKITGISAERPFVDFATRSLFQRFRPIEGQGKVKVLYFAGCYAGYIRPEIGLAAVKALNHLGIAVRTPPQHCCGLPMVSKGMAAEAKQKVKQNLRQWQHLLDSVEYVVTTCSSCSLALMQEWRDLLNDDVSGLIAEKTIHISRLVLDHLDAVAFKPNDVHLAYHYPCHLKVQPEPEASQRMLSRIGGVQVTALDSHCCGMAGTWGFSAANFDLSARLGTDLVDRLNATKASYAVTDCPTCRIQMEHLGHLPVKHPIEILAACLDE